MRISLFMALVGVALGLLGATLVGASIYSNKLSAGDEADLTDCESGSTCEETVQYSVQRLVPLTKSLIATPAGSLAFTPTGESTPALFVDAPASAPPTPTPTLKITVVKAVSTTALPRQEQTQAAVDNILPTVTATVTPSSTNIVTNVAPVVTATVETKEETKKPKPASDYVEPYTSTHQVTPPPSARTPTPVPEPTPGVTCPVSSTTYFDLIPIEGLAVKDHPDSVHGDLNLALRGFIPVEETLDRVHYNGNTDTAAPRLHGLFEPNRQAQISGTYRVNDWIWDSSRCGGHPRGCPGAPTDNYWPVTMAGLAVSPGETVHIPERGPEIYPGGFIAMVLYAEEKRLTLGYTRRDTVSAGYVVHLENICVDANLIALYQAQMDGAGWHATGHLPALRNNQPVGIALDSEIKVAIRDSGTFMDPRSHKDWWE